MNKTAWRQPTNRVRSAPHTGLRSVVAYLPLESIVPDSSNPRKHSPEQVRAIARSIEAFGFNAPILVDKANRVVAGHGRLEAAKRLNLAEVPAIRLEHLSQQQAKAYMLPDNKLSRFVALGVRRRDARRKCRRQVRPEGPSQSALLVVP
jgi:hypothetical protein